MAGVGAFRAAAITNDWLRRTDTESEDTMERETTGSRRRLMITGGRRFRRAGLRVGTVGVGLVGLVWLASTALGAVVQVPVLTTPRDEIQPAAADGWLAWSQNSVAHPNLYSEYARPSGGARFRVNHVGTQGFGGGIDGTTLVYQQVSRGQSAIKLFNLATHARSNPPTGVNTPRWEFSPTISGSWILFGRANFAVHRWRVILFNTATHQLIVLADRTGRNVSAAPGQVNGNFAVWQQCTATACNVWEYDIGAATKTQLPNTTPGHFNYASSVDSTGTAYFAHSGNSCGATIEKRPVGGPTSVVVALRGRDVESSYLATITSQSNLFFAKFNCRTKSDDIYKIIAP
jgi:hypothetical protein